MCGIFGVIQNHSISKEKLLSVSRIIKHRGPDDEGYLLFDNYTNNFQIATGPDSTTKNKFPNILKICEEYNSAFLHRRLSIIDLTEKGHQPMDYNGNFWIICNGEIYNYIELKEELEKKGYHFKSKSDTEVILAAYQEWGIECINRFNGMWAFAIWDRVNNIISLSRDRIGIKPLYYYNKNGVFIFCSEIKGIRNYLSNQLSISENKIKEYLSTGQIFIGESDQTFFKDVKQLMPGNNLILNKNNIIIKTYWQLELTKNNFPFNKNVEIFKELFFQSIKYRLRSDVEVGTCLSGGIDSSSIVSFSSKSFNKKFNTFSVIWPGEKCDESFYIEKVNQKNNCISHAFEPDLDDILNIIEKVIWHLEIPLTGSSLIAQWFVMEKAKNSGIKVLLDGEGSDEILSGYPRYITSYIIEMIHYFKWKEIIKYYSSLKKSGYTLKKILRIQKYRVTKLNLITNSNNLKYKYFPYKYNFLPRYLKDEIEKFTLPTLLHNKDRNSMAHSIEARVPYLDHNLIEFAVNIPSEQKIFGANTKVILKEAMKEVLPFEVYERTDKIGFAAPIENRIFSINSHFYKITQNYIKNSNLMKMDLLDIKSIQTIFNERTNFAIYSLAKFYDIWS